jgi:chromosome segregation ATPase
MESQDAKKILESLKQSSRSKKDKPKPLKEIIVPAEDVNFKKNYLELLGLRKKVKALEENAEDVDKIENELGKQISDLQKSNSDYQNKLMIAQKKIETFETVKSGLTEQIRNLKDSVKGIETEKTKLEQDLSKKLADAITEIANFKETIETRVKEGIELGLKDERAKLEVEKQAIEDTKLKLKQREAVIESGESFTGKYGLLTLISAGLLGLLYAYIQLIPSLIPVMTKLSFDYKIIGVVAVLIALIVPGIIRKRRDY